MCSMAECEMLVSHSPPVFSHSPPTSFLSDYPAFRLGFKPCRSYLSTNNNNAKFPNKMPASPKRPCLVIRPEDQSSDQEDPSSPTRLKKKVVFADDKGMSLTHVRIMTEPSNVPPLWSFRFLAEVTHGLIEPSSPSEPWDITFPQPASDYVDFRKRLDTEKVSLENVIIKENEDKIIGTVKVKNIAFHKEVVVRSSSDSWKTYEDTFCTYVNNTLSGNSAYILYDTFSFQIALNPKAKKLEFCVCFRCENSEFWDNNNGKNYILVKKVQFHKSLSADDVFRKELSKEIVGNKYVDVVQAKMDSWSEFASWNHLENSNPYCFVGA